MNYQSTYFEKSSSLYSFSFHSTRNESPGPVRPSNRKGPNYCIKHCDFHFNNPVFIKTATCFFQPLRTRFIFLIYRSKIPLVYQ